MDEYDESIKIVFDDSAYTLVTIKYKDFAYLIPTLGGLISILTFGLKPIMEYLKKKQWQHILDKVAQLLGNGRKDGSWSKMGHQTSEQESRELTEEFFEIDN